MPVSLKSYDIRYRNLLLHRHPLPEVSIAVLVMIAPFGSFSTESINFVFGDTPIDKITISAGYLPLSITSPLPFHLYLQTTVPARWCIQPHRFSPVRLLLLVQTLHQIHSVPDRVLLQCGLTSLSVIHRLLRSQVRCIRHLQ